MDGPRAGRPPLGAAAAHRDLVPVQRARRRAHGPSALGRHRGEEDDDDRAVAGALADTDVADLAGREYTSLSGGERARAALARVLAQATGILLLDEPTAALDLQHQELVMGVARERATSGTAVVVVAHDLALAAAWADRVVVLERGALVADGPPREVLTEALLSRVYRTPVEVDPASVDRCAHHPAPSRSRRLTVHSAPPTLAVRVRP